MSDKPQYDHDVLELFDSEAIMNFSGCSKNRNRDRDKDREKDKEKERDKDGREDATDFADTAAVDESSLILDSDLSADNPTFSIDSFSKLADIVLLSNEPESYRLNSGNNEVLIYLEPNKKYLKYIAKESSEIRSEGVISISDFQDSTGEAFMSITQPKSSMVVDVEMKLTDSAKEKLLEFISTFSETVSKDILNDC